MNKKVKDKQFSRQKVGFEIIPLYEYKNGV